MNKKTVLLFQDYKSNEFLFENRLTALLFDKDTAEKTNDIIYEENEDGEPVNNFKTIEEIKEIFDKNGFAYEEIDLRFVDYNNDQED